MGDTISSLVFRPPRPTPIHPSEYFYLDVDVHSPLCTNKRHPNNNTHHPTSGDGEQHGSCGSTMCLDTGESDLASLDASFIPNTAPLLSGACSSAAYHRTNSVASSSSAVFINPSTPSGTIPNMRNGQIYKIPAFFIRRRNATQTILFSHGNAEDLGMMYNRMKDLAMVLGVNILAYDYTGYGLSIPGPAHGNGSPNNHGTSGVGNDNENDNTNNVEGPSENMIYRNIEAAYRYLTQTRKIPPHQIILYGRSLGSGPSCYLAAKSALNGNSVGGLILHSPFLSVYKVVADLNGLDMGLVGDMFHNEKRARNIRCPTLIIHGREDEVVPFWHAQRLLAAIPPEFRVAPYYVEKMGHNHIESRCREQYVRVVLNFLRMRVWSQNRSSLNEQRYALHHGSVQQSYGTATASSANVQPYRGPSPIPIHERASPSEMKENASFYVNKTWLRHAKVLLKEVFVDAGCYVNSVSDGSNDSRWERRSQQQRCATPSAATSHHQRRSGHENNVDRYTKGMSDARDDEDEFALWRGSSSSNNKKVVRSSASPTILTTARPDSSNNGGGNVSRPHVKSYYKAQSMPPSAEVYSERHTKKKSISNDNNVQQQQQQTRASRYGKSKSMALLEGMNRPRRI